MNVFWKDLLSMLLPLEQMIENALILEGIFFKFGT